MTSTARIWTGRIASTLPALMLVLSAGVKLSHRAQLVAMFSDLGYPDGLLTALAVLELGCTALYVVPRTSALGALLLTGYLGGAISAHVRVGHPFVAPLVLGLLVWGGLYLRDARLRALLPLRWPEGNARTGDSSFCISSSVENSHAPFAGGARAEARDRAPGRRNSIRRIDWGRCREVLLSGAIVLAAGSWRDPS